MVSFCDPVKESFAVAVWEAISSKENHNQCPEFWSYCLSCLASLQVL